MCSAQPNNDLVVVLVALRKSRILASAEDSALVLCGMAVGSYMACGVGSGVGVLYVGSRMVGFGVGPNDLGRALCRYGCEIWLRSWGEETS